ncbi:hypothetical protein TBLA_0J00570 [Henningerozyma blattae CBS 6284]|uniref:Ras-GEF domain-containing protein n=1 Tax=Henningerozyma blattae (strain ATCC 34711 / CBS 6284 / DSM 70876 / NBRC 10599 / NRRL Y-10934 / UCD 77-7) TaxID=1071380 RepID=I2H9K5_HENB6|nr:hypothetical protein TBLA_0J00570 [Tetrapisispora blattae CBS 6284]CCH63057.1 hypothetical protein TBLA_0J00570 [Tetrapisispora blattae CBS 6284]
MQSSTSTQTIRQEDEEWPLHATQEPTDYTSNIPSQPRLSTAADDTPIVGSTQPVIDEAGLVTPRVNPPTPAGENIQGSTGTKFSTGSQLRPLSFMGNRFPIPLPLNGKNSGNPGSSEPTRPLAGLGISTGHLNSAMDQTQDHIGPTKFGDVMRKELVSTRDDDSHYLDAIDSESNLTSPLRTRSIGNSRANSKKSYPSNTHISNHLNSNTTHQDHINTRGYLNSPELGNSSPQSWLDDPTFSTQSRNNIQDLDSKNDIHHTPIVNSTKQVSRKVSIQTPTQSSKQISRQNSFQNSTPRQRSPSMLSIHSNINVNNQLPGIFPTTSTSTSVYSSPDIPVETATDLHMFHQKTNNTLTTVTTAGNTIATAFIQDDSSFLDETKDTFYLDPKNSNHSRDTSYISKEPILENTMEDETIISSTTRSISQLNLSDSNLSYLFILAIHSFNSESLQNPDDIEICLSFEKNDLAFVHTVDESGWGEVTLVKNGLRGWVPFNYFSDSIKSTSKSVIPPNISSSSPSSRSSISSSDLIESRAPLEPLLNSCARFLLSPNDLEFKPIPNHFTFNINYINAIRDGVKHLLESTNCVSRSNEMVQLNPQIRRSRKKLLADWYNLMLKADHYKNTTSEKNITLLISMIFKVLQRSMEFFNTWSFTKKNYNKITSPLTKNKSKSKANKKPTSTDSRNSIPYLNTPPNAMARLHEIYDMLFSYIGIIMGRLDMIEFNPKGCEYLEIMTHQLIILLRELIFISKSCSAIIEQKYKNEYENNLEKSLDPLLTYVSELVSCVKFLITESLQYNLSNTKNTLKKINEQNYIYSNQGERLLNILSHMLILITTSVTGCNNYLLLIGDFTLHNDRKYPDFKQIRLTPTEFIQNCSKNLIKDILKNPTLYDKFQSISNNKTDTIRATSSIYSGDTPNAYKSSARFSRIRSTMYNDANNMNENDWGLTQQGTQFLNDLITNDYSFANDSSFAKFKLNDEEMQNAANLNSNNSNNELSEAEAVNDKETMQGEMLLNKNGDIIGASFRALVFKLTDEMDKSNDFFTATVLLNFRTFGSLYELIELLISRFDLSNKCINYDYGETNGKFYSKASQIKNRRKLVARIFQNWMESYWDYSTDYKLLPTMINFFNEGVSQYLPVESKMLLELAAKLTITAFRTSHTVSKYSKEITSSHTVTNESLVTTHQLLPKDIRHSRTNSIISDVSTISSTSSLRSNGFSFDEGIIGRYELTHIYSEDDPNSMSLPMPILNIGTSSLLTKVNITDIEKTITKYRSITAVAFQAESNQSNMIKRVDLKGLISKWKLLNDNNSIHPSDLILNKLSLTDINPLEVAKQLTLIESALLMNVQANELLNENFLEKKAKFKKAPNVNAIITFTNQLSNYVLDCILNTEISTSQRVRRFENWLKIALSTLYFRNFNSIGSIMIALQNHAISRLKFIWDNLSEKDQELYDYLARIVHPSHNYKVYRKKLRNLMDEYFPGNIQISKSPLPVVPFFNLFLQDLTFINEGNPNYRNPDSFRPHKLINIEKYFQITKTLSVIQFFQVSYETQSNYIQDNSNTTTASYPFSDKLDIDTKCISPIPLLQEFILHEFWRVNTLYKQNSDRAYQMSLEIVPRN